MATQYINEANLVATVEETEVTFVSNKAKARLFDSKAISLTKTQDKSLVVSGSTITYTVVIKNKSEDEISDVNFIDVLPSGLSYIIGTFSVNSVTTEPVISGQELSYTITTLLSGETTVIFSCLVA